MSDFTLHPYQNRFCNQVARSFSGSGDIGPFTKVLGTAATGAGKTIIASALIKHWRTKEDAKCLFIVDTNELCSQSVDKLYASRGIVADLEKAESRASLSSPVVVASIQSLSGRLENWPTDHFGYVIADECFVAGTMVATAHGPKPIEEVRAGEMVAAFDHGDGEIKMRRVNATRASIPSSLVTVRTSRGRELTGTPNHPFYCDGAYKACCELEKGGRLVAYEIQQRMQVPDVRKNMEGGSCAPILLRRVQDKKHGEESGELPDLRRANSILGAIPEVLAEGGEAILSRMRAESYSRRQQGLRAVGEIQYGAWGGADAEKQSYAEYGVTGQNEGFSGSDWTQTQKEGREWNRTGGMRVDTGGCNRAANKRHGSNAGGKGLRLPESLQTGPWGREAKIGGGSGWELAWITGAQGAGQKKRAIPGGDRVESVEIHKPTSDGRFAGLCGNGFVYNLEIEGLSNYFANGVLVHNCHMSMADGWQRTLKHFHGGGARILGITATPERGDKQSLMRFYEHVAAEIPLAELIVAKHLSPIVVETIPLKITIKSKVTEGDNDALGEEMKAYYEAILDAMEVHAADRKKFLWFHPSVASSQEFHRLLRARGEESAHVDGTSQDRISVLNGFAAGRYRHLNNCAMLTKGYDCLDSQTEILTENGWRGMGTVAVGDMVQTLNRETGLLELMPVLRCVERAMQEGESMAVLKGQRANIRVSEGHEFHIKYMDPKKGVSQNWLTKTGKEISERKSVFVMPVGAPPAQAKPGIDLTDDEIRFVAWFMTDGGFQRSAVVISQAKEKTSSEIEDLLGRLGLFFVKRIRHNRKGAYANGKPLNSYHVPKGNRTGTFKRSGWEKYAPYLSKDVATALHGMTIDQFRIFWSTAMKGDGSVMENKAGWLWCDRMNQVDAYMQMALERGMTASYSKHPDKPAYRVSISDRNWLHCNGGKIGTKTVLEKPNPGEKVWCVQNQNSTLVTRRGGKVAIIGNCPDIDCVVILRPTKSRTLYIQMAGRGTRLYCPHGCTGWCEHDDRKKNLKLLDFLWAFEDHDVMGPADLVTDVAAHRNALAGILKRGGDLDLLDSDEEAVDARQEKLLDILKSRSRRKGYNLDAMEWSALMDLPELLDYEPCAPWQFLPATPKQIEVLTGRAGLAESAITNRGHASQLLSAYMDRVTSGLASPKQVLTMLRSGRDDAAKCTFSEASAFIDKLAAKRGKGRARI